MRKLLSLFALWTMLLSQAYPQGLQMDRINVKGITNSGPLTGSGDNPLVWGGSLGARRIEGELQLDGYGGTCTSDGIGDCLSAFNAMCVDAAGRVMHIPAGTWKLSATPTSCVGSDLKFRGDGKNVSIVNLAAGAYLVDDNQGWSSCLYKGIRVNNGAGAIRNRSTANAGQGGSSCEVDDVYFNNYTGAAISDNEADHPYWKIRHSTFMGANTTSTIGVALAGDNSRSEVCENAFLNNFIHLKFANPKPLTVCGNDFIQFSSGSSRASIWLVPTHDAFTFTSQGMQILANKFGSENLATSDFRILAADEGSGTFVGDRLPVTTASTGHVGGMQIIGNFVSGASGTGNPFVYSYTPNVTGMQIGPIQMAGTAISTVLQYDAVATPTSVGRSNVIGPILLDPTLKTTNLTATVFPLATNASWTAWVVDPDGWMVAHDNSLPTAYAAGTSIASLTNFSPTTITGWITGGSTTSSNIADVDAGADAVELTMPQNGTWRQASAGGNLTAGVPTYVEFDLKVGSTSPLGTIYVNLQQSGVTYWGQDFTVTSSTWRRYRGEFVLPSATTLVAFIQNVNASGTVDVGRFKIYQAYEPIGGGDFLTPIYTTIGNFTGQIKSTLATGTAPLVVASTTPVANLVAGGNTVTVASGTATFTTTAVSASTCQTTVTATATGAATTDAIEAAYATAPTGTTDGLLILNKWVTSGNVNFARCNPTAGSITPTALVLNWRVTR